MWRLCWGVLGRGWGCLGWVFCSGLVLWSRVWIHRCRWRWIVFFFPFLGFRLRLGIDLGWGGTFECGRFFGIGFGAGSSCLGIVRGLRELLVWIFLLLRVWECSSRWRYRFENIFFDLWIFLPFLAYLLKNLWGFWTEFRYFCWENRVFFRILGLRVHLGFRKSLCCLRRLLLRLLGLRCFLRFCFGLSGYQLTLWCRLLLIMIHIGPVVRYFLWNLLNVPFHGSLVLRSIVWILWFVFE